MLSSKENFKFLMNLAEDTWLHCTSKTAQTIRFYCNLQLTRDMIVIRAHNLPLGARTNRIDYVIKLVQRWGIENTTLECVGK